MTSYLAYADEIAESIAKGSLLPGTKLPPQRIFADRRGIAVSTASRVYGELVRRGLAIGEVGRGTFVRSSTPASRVALAGPATVPVDLELNATSMPAQTESLARALKSLLRTDGLADALLPVGTKGTGRVREVSAQLLSRAGWMPAPESFLFAGNGKQAIAAVFSALAKPGERIGVEALTYPVVKSIASRLGIHLVPIEMDGEGILPNAIEDTHRLSRLAAVYFQSTLQNPLGCSMSSFRKEELAKVLERNGIHGIEDGVYSFLADELPVVAALPEAVILIDSLSKRIAPGLSIGFIVAPPKLREAISFSIQSGSWSTSGFALAASLRMMEDGCIPEIQEQKRLDARNRQRLASIALADLNVISDSRSYHLWLELPHPWRAERFSEAASRQGIALLTASAFSIGNGHAPSAVRLALATPPLDQLERALGTLKEILDAGDDMRLE